MEKIGLEDELTNLRQLRKRCEKTYSSSSISSVVLCLLHSDEADLAELRSRSVINDLDPSQFFRNELSEAVREIRNEYETTLANRRTDLQNRYSVTINEMAIRTQQYDANPFYNEQQRRQVEHRRNELIQTQNQNNQLRNKNREMQDSIEDLKQRIRFLQENGKKKKRLDKRLTKAENVSYFHEDFAARKKAERDIEEARRRLERVEREYAETTIFKTTLEKEIATYRELLEGKSRDSNGKFSSSLNLQVQLVFDDLLIESFKMRNKKHSNDRVRLTLFVSIRIKQPQELWHILISILPIRIIVILSVLRVLFDERILVPHHHLHRIHRHINEYQSLLLEVFLSTMKQLDIVLHRIVPYVERSINKPTHKKILNKIVPIGVV